jgi:hypothetical protein
LNFALFQILDPVRQLSITVQPGHTSVSDSLVPSSTLHEAARQHPSAQYLDSHPIPTPARDNMLRDSGTAAASAATLTDDLLAIFAIFGTSHERNLQHAGARRHSIAFAVT